MHESGSNSDLNTDMPISVISVLAKMLERLAHDQLSVFLKISNILRSSQAAFCKLYSTAISLISSKDHRQENMNSNKMNLTIFLDLRKVFDTDYMTRQAWQQPRNRRRKGILKANWRQAVSKGMESRGLRKADASH